MGSNGLSSRSRRLLTTLVRAYVDAGEPVPSQVLARDSGLGLSSATIRNELAQLERDGYLRQPHTSAGRVPTDLAYRVFVDLLIESHKPARAPALVEHQLRQQAERSPLVDDMLASVSHLVARAARHVGFALSASDDARLQRIEFVALGGSRLLVVVVSDGGRVTQKMVDIGEEVRADDLVQAANYLNTEFSGLPLLQVRDAVCARLEQERTLYDQLLTRALRIAQCTLESLPEQPAFHVEGAASLIESSQDGLSLGTLRALFEMMEEKQRLVRLLNQYIDGPGLTVVIGAEHSAPHMRPFSLIASTVVDHGATRTVGLIGPTRMDYSRAIALVDGTTHAVTRVLRSN